MCDLIEIKGKGDQNVCAMKFLTKAMLKDGNRPHLSHICIQDGYAAATDGSRIHRCNLDGDFNDGLYRIFKISAAHFFIHRSDKLSIDKDFPEYIEFFDTEGDRYKSLRISFTPQVFAHAITKLLRFLPEGQSININYAMDLNGYYDVFVDQKGDKPFIFMAADHSAAIMPMRVDN